jgi:hypothetical protein
MLTFRGGAHFNYYHHYADKGAMFDWVAKLGLTTPDAAATAVHDDGVEDGRDRMHAVEVVGQPSCRLRVPGREDPRRLQASQDVDAARRADSLGSLRENVRCS